MPGSIRIDRDVPMEMRDGTILRADVYRPEDNAKHPVILMRTPYNKLLASASGDYLNIIDTVFMGYAIVAQDARGRFASEGEYASVTSRLAEGPDGYDSVEWLASQPWCDGNVGMAGGSYLAHLQWRTAMENPPHLKAIAPWISPIGGGIPEETLLGGVGRLHTTVGWIPAIGLDIADRLERQGRDVSDMRKLINRAIFSQEEVYNYLPLKDVPHFKFEGLQEVWNAWVCDPVPKVNTLEEIFWPYQEIKVPCFHVGGWYDEFIHSTFHNFLSMREKGGSERARDGQHMIIGPWAHGGSLPNCLGGICFGPVSSGRAVLLTERHIQFYNKYLRDMYVEVPVISYFVMGRNIWQTADTWPLPQTQWRRFFLHSSGHANTVGGDGLLSRDELGAEPPDMFIYNPYFPVPTMGGRNYPPFGLVAGPINQSDVERRNDVLCYTTKELDEDMEVTGPLMLHLFASTSARDTDFTAKLIDVHPDGFAYNVADGMTRARYRKSILQPELLNPGEVYEYSIDMRNTSQVFGKGHRIRIDISSSNFPAADRNMNTGSPIGEDAEGIPAMQMVFHQSEYASYIDLPVII